MKKTTQFRNLLKEEGALITPGVFDCISAKLAEKAGFQAILIGGAGLSASLLGYPDVGLMTMTENLAQARNIIRSVDIPAFVDCDTGYGSALNLSRTVREFEEAGAAGLFFEDQAFPKKCGHFEGKQLISQEEMVKKIEAALDARKDPDLIIMARTDAIAVLGIDEAVKRAKAYEKAGADMVFMDAPHNIEHLKIVANATNLPAITNVVEGGKTPLLSVQELEQLGFKIIGYSGSAQKAAIMAMEAVFQTLHDKRSLDDVIDKIVSLKGRSDLLNLQSYYEMEQKYSVAS